jgi:hypothetical protein
MPEHVVGGDLGPEDFRRLGLRLQQLESAAAGADAFLKLADAPGGRGRRAVRFRRLESPPLAIQLCGVSFVGGEGAAPFAPPGRLARFSLRRRAWPARFRPGSRGAAGRQKDGREQQKERSRHLMRRSPVTGASP